MVETRPEILVKAGVILLECRQSVEVFMSDEVSGSDGSVNVLVEL